MRNSKKKPIFNLESLLKARKTKCAVCKSNLRVNQTLRKKSTELTSIRILQVVALSVLRAKLLNYKKNQKHIPGVEKI